MERINEDIEILFLNQLKKELRYIDKKVYKAEIGFLRRLITQKLEEI